MTASKLVPRKEKYWVLGVSKLFKISSRFLNVRLVIRVSIDIFLVFLYYVSFYKIVTGLSVSEFNQMYEMLG